MSSAIKLSPVINDGSYIYYSYSMSSISNVTSIAVLKEREGYTHIMKKEDAIQNKIKFKNEWCWITLEYVSDLEGTGITASFSNALNDAEIPCNVMAGYYHDHIFVPYSMRLKAFDILKNLKIVINS